MFVCPTCRRESPGPECTACSREPARPLAGVPDDPRDEVARAEVVAEACRLLADALDPAARTDFDPAALEVVGGRPRFAASPAADVSESIWSPPEFFASGPPPGPAADVWRVGLYAYLRLAGLLPAGLPGHGPRACGFEMPELRLYRPGLPFGLWPVLRRALAPDPRDRFATAGEFAAALEDAVEQARLRRLGSDVRIDTGSATVIGASHVAMGLPNQDNHVSMSLSRSKLLSVVADGVTHSSIGSGEVASRIAVDVMADRLAASLSRAETVTEVEQAVTDACHRAAQSILVAALADYPEPSFEPTEVMSSTAVVGYLDGDRALLASVGDSRAYLVAGGVAEQLTIDGDVRSLQLHYGMPPEEVALLGPDAFALYTCLGVAATGPDGRYGVCAERSMPRFARVRLRPGDVLVLCTDGLVEEGYFLSEKELPGLVAQGGSAQEIAERLLQAAAARHRWPSAAEPLGCGDDVTLVVWKAE